MRRYLAASSLPLDSESSANRWLRVTDGADVVAIIGQRVHSDVHDLAITDFYPAPGRKGILAMYAVVEVLRWLVDGGFINSASWATAASNVRHNQALKRLGGEPVAHLWRYGKAPITATQVSDSAPEAGSHMTSDNEIFGVSSVTLNRAFAEFFGIDGSEE
ncbi:MAG: hypothetical protein JO322_06830 [Candidatus Eremiobacteraeota bacterium]|nr:hypothetical protein [Candidatus Eremiobacteraeota bacterium]